MKSRFADKYNHDDEAAGYDADVADERNPIRAGYGELLDWVVAEARVTASTTVLELGSGTGNLSARLDQCRRLLCVDVSERMLALARKKLSGLDYVEFLQADLLGIFDSLEGRFDAIISTYAIHHLSAQEKASFFRSVAQALVPGGRAVFGDLMFADGDQRQRYLQQLRATDQAAMADDIEDEFFWDLDWAVGQLVEAGMRVKTKRFSELSWGIVARAAP